MKRLPRSLKTAAANALQARGGLSGRRDVTA